jgi:hypothetical protein
VQKERPVEVDELAAFRECIVRSYGSVERPNWSFVNDVVSRNPYDGLTEELARFGHLEDDTDVNCDVSFTYLVRRRQRPISVRLSMVGPYALLLVATSDHPDGPLDVISTVDDAGSQDERAIVELLDQQGFKVMSGETLERTIRFSLNNEQVAPLYRALFSFEEEIPWRGLPPGAGESAGRTPRP